MLRIYCGKIATRCRTFGKFATLDNCSTINSIREVPIQEADHRFFCSAGVRELKPYLALL